MGYEGPIRTTTVTLNTSIGTQDITIPGAFGANPKGAVFIAGGGADGVLESHGSFSTGFCDGTNQITSVMSAEDASTTNTNTYRTLSNNYVIYIFNATTGTTNFRASFDSWLTDGVRINITTPPSTTKTITVILFGGDDVESVAVGSFSLGTLTTPVTRTIGQETSLLLTHQNGNSSLNITDPNVFASFGMVVNDGSGSQYCLAMSDTDNLATSDTWQQLHTAGMATTMRGYIAYNVTFDNFTATGFDTTSSASASNRIMGYMSVKLSDNVKAKLIVADSPTATGDFQITGAGTRPEFVLGMLSETTAIDTLQSGFSITLSAIDASSESCLSYSSKDAVATTVAKTRYTSQAIADLTDGDTDLHNGTFSSFDSDGFTLNFPTDVAGTSRQWVFLTVGPAAVNPAIGEIFRPVFRSIFKEVFTSG